MFRAEVRFYREIAPVVGVRVPVCIEADDTGEGTRLLLEDLSSWAHGADPVRVARQLAALHRHWEGRALERWPWLRQAGAAVNLVSALFDDVWPRLRRRSDLSAEAGALGERAVGRVEELETAAAAAGPCTLCHGDASFDSVFTGPDGKIAFADWEDVGCAPGVTDLAWLLVSSVAPGRWDEVFEAYGPAQGLPLALPAAGIQGLLTLADLSEGGAEAQGWVERLTATEQRLAAAERAGSGRSVAPLGGGGATRSAAPDVVPAASGIHLTARTATVRLQASGRWLAALLEQASYQGRFTR